MSLHMDPLPEHDTLVTAGGSPWKVSVSTGIRGVLLDKEWPGLMEFHGIKMIDAAVFTYDRKGHFLATIFNTITRYERGSFNTMTSMKTESPLTIIFLLTSNLKWFSVHRGC